jgi:hypothetical protein
MVFNLINNYNKKIAGLKSFKDRQQWRIINRKQSARWQHLHRLKAGAFFSLQKQFLVVKEHKYLYLGLVMPSCG